MSITINGTTMADVVGTYSNVCTSYYDDYGTNYYGTLTAKMILEKVVETSDNYQVTWHMTIGYDGPYSRSSGNKLDHTGNSLQIRPYYKLASKSAVFATAQNHVIYNQNGTLNYFPASVFTIPKQNTQDKLNFGFQLEGVWTVESSTNVVSSVWDPNKSGWPGGHYPFFQASNTNSDPGHVTPAGSWFKTESWNTGVTIAASGAKVWVYNASGVPKRGQVYVYDSTGKPRKATGIWVYDSTGKPRKFV